MDIFVDRRVKDLWFLREVVLTVPVGQFVFAYILYEPASIGKWFSLLFLLSGLGLPGVPQRWTQIQTQSVKLMETHNIKFTVLKAFLESTEF